MTFHDIVVDTHLSFGTVALTSFWINALLPKGTRLHRQIGAVYFLAIAGVIASALPLTVHAFVTGQTVAGVFLSYLVIVTSTALWTAWRAIRDRVSVETFIGHYYRPLAWLNLAAAVTVLVLGVARHAPLLAGFSIFGLLVAGRMLQFLAKPPTEPSWWVQRHYLGIVGSGVATHIAFLNFGLRHVIALDRSDMALYLLAWFGPVLVAMGIIRWLNHRYGPRTARAQTAVQRSRCARGGVAGVAGINPSARVQRLM
jgi:uncharacterized membrane protein